MSMNSKILIRASQNEIATPIFATGLVESVTPPLKCLFGHGLQLFRTREEGL